VFVIFSEYFCSEATEARSRLTNEKRKTAHVVSAVPGCIVRSRGLVASGLDMQHLRKAWSWTSSGEQLSSDLLLAETMTQ